MALGFPDLSTDSSAMSAEYFQRSKHNDDQYYDPANHSIKDRAKGAIHGALIGEDKPAASTLTRRDIKTRSNNRLMLARGVPRRRLRPKTAKTAVNVVEDLMAPMFLDVSGKPLGTIAAAISRLELIMEANPALPSDKLVKYWCLLFEYNAAAKRIGKKVAMSEPKQKTAGQRNENKEVAVSGTSDVTGEKLNTIKELFAQIKVPTAATPSVESPTRLRKRKRTDQSPASDGYLKRTKPSK